MADPVIAQKMPYETQVEVGKSYFWCACGRSASQPFCDGSHRGTGMTPVKYECRESGTVFFCGCKRSGDQPFCDGTHDTL
ncbi:MAG: CDGSH iron-sulfur domain-containing protein [Acidobacteriota bacterium]